MVKKNPLLKKKVLPPKWGWVSIITVSLIVVCVLLLKNNLSVAKIFSKITPTPTPPLITVDIVNRAFEEKDYVNLAVDDLSKRISLTKDKIKVIKVTPKDWSDASLGCPQKGEVYLQMIISGFLIELSDEKNIYPYHAGSNRVVSCKLD